VIGQFKIKSCPLIRIKKIFLFLLLFSPAFVHAQVDTAILSDTLIEYIEEPPPPQEAITVPDTYESEDEDYFLEKSDFESDNKIVPRKVPDSILKKMRQDDDFWYANADIKKEKKPEVKKSEYKSLRWLDTLLWIIIIGVFIAVIFTYLSGSNVGLFRRKSKVIQATDEAEMETVDIFMINYQKEIDKAESSGNYRLATRLLFLKLLKIMSEKNIIQYKQDRTNLDYLFQLQSKGYYNIFFRITRNYEYSWYGKFDVVEEAYRKIKNDFNQMDLQINHI
jgi:hypothetical protein